MQADSEELLLPRKILKWPEECTVSREKGNKKITGINKGWKGQQHTAGGARRHNTIEMLVAFAKG